MSNAVLKEEIELLGKLEDAKFFTETFFFIIDKDRKKVPFILNPAQARYYANRTNFDLILKARKEGFSSLIEAMWLHACLFVPNTRAVVLSHELESTKRHFDRVRYYLETMGFSGAGFSVDLDEDTQKQIRFPQTNSSYWIGTGGAKSFGRGDDITHLHISEVAHYQHQDVLTGVLEACVPSARRVLETTANGVGEFFHKLWRESEDPQSGSPWKSHFFAWFDDQGYRLPIPIGVPFRLTSQEQRMKDRYKLDNEQILWYRTKRSEMPDKTLMPQEYPSNAQEAFLSSGRHVFDLEKINEAKERIKDVNPQRVGYLEDDGKSISLYDHDEGTLAIWKMPRKQRMYLISADVAEGVPGGAYSVAHVFDRASHEVVARIRLRVDPGTWGKMLVDLGYFYENAVIVPENNNHGHATIERIKIEEYPHLLNTREIWPNQTTPVDGFPTNQKTKPLIITAGRNAIDGETVYCPDLVTWGELETYVQNESNGKYEPQEGCWADCVMSFCIGVYCLNYLTVDETYAPRAKHRLEESFYVESVVSVPKGKHRSRTGYR